MPVLTFTFDTGTVALSEIVDAVCFLYGYQPVIDGNPNPQTKAEFARQQVREFIVAAVKAKRAADVAAGVPEPLIV